MVIEFRCPNGHRLNCPEERAGLPGKCPKCKATFRVPQPGGSGIERPDAPISDSGVSEPEMAAAPTDSGSFPTVSDSGKFANPAEEAVETNTESTPPTDAPTSTEERIVFLCPQGHKLNCPASMQGRPGKCPHCGATFLVPQYEPGEEEDDDDDDDESSEQETGDDSSHEHDADEGLVEQAIEGFNGDAFEGDPFAFDFSSLTTNESVNGHPMAGVFQRLWVHRQSGGIVEMYLKGGEVIAPEWFSPRQSQESYGMFAFVERDGTYTMTAVNWDAIERIAVRGVAALPQGMFEEEG